MTTGMTALVVIIGILAVFAAVTTVWSIVWDLRAYRNWKDEQSASQPRHVRRQCQKDSEELDKDAKRWRRHIVALQIALLGFVFGVGTLVAGYLTRKPFPIVIGGNLFVMGIMAWLAYQLVLPKPKALREKQMPKWLAKKR